MNLSHRVDTPTYSPIWDAKQACPTCSHYGVYVFANKIACYQCWARSASERGYTGSIGNDPFWAELREEESAKTPAKITPLHRLDTAGCIRSNFHSSTFHLVLDIAVVMALIATLTFQNRQIRNLQLKINALQDAAVILLQDKLERDKWLE